MATQEEKYINKRFCKARLQSIPFYLFRIFPVKKRKVVFTTIEGTTGFTCNPKYIALELLECNKILASKERWELVWLLTDINKVFPDGIKKVKNTLINRAFHLTTARFWIDNSRKQLEARKRRNQIYIQTWHAKLGFKPTGLDRGASFSKIAYLVTKHDSDMIDYWLSNSDWYDRTLKTGSLYEGKILRTGSPRCDILVKSRDNPKFKTEMKQYLCNLYNIDNSCSEIHFLMYAPTYREGNSEITRKLSTGGQFPDYKILQKSLEQRFGGKWYILLRLHPQLVARHIESGVTGERLLDGSKVDDMYELLAGCDAFLTDYSSAAFDAAVMEIPVFLYCDDYKKYEGERGKLLWDLRKLPFPLSESDAELAKAIEGFNEKDYNISLKNLFSTSGVEEDGFASKHVVETVFSL
ncbi:MAG: CDP-glycerol glycerophosphotransferase family protein [Treponema sp.]|nr:CDP-glycerol glycerophosphotransferase family protein [Treponema sp.]